MSSTLQERVELDLGLDDAGDVEGLRRAVARRLARDPSDLPEIHVQKRSIDARKGRVRVHVVVGLGARPELASLAQPEPREPTHTERVVIVGGGPAGLFAAYELARLGVASTIVERGKPVQPRRHDLAKLSRGEGIDPDSNYCFGEGGAGTYSDGKLYTRSDKRGPVRDVGEILARHGAPERILSDARPHIGSNRLPKVITAMREHLESVGVVFRFSAKVTGLLVEPGPSGRRVRGVRLEGGEEIEGDATLLATGHSARDVHHLLHHQGVRLEPKAFALGVRIEHPQPLIDRVQYGRSAGHPALPAASYRVAHTEDGASVFSFCMCPGGFIVPATTAPGELVVNGMSLSRRDSPYANSGLVVGVSPAQWQAAGFEGPLGGFDLQHAIEAAAWTAGGGRLVAPATRATDFLRGRASTTVPASSYHPGLVAGDVASVLDVAGLDFAARIARALRVFDRKLPGYASEAAVLVATESRTSSPVRIPRDPVTLTSPDLAGLYPAAEGAGYAGGIVSAAIDGMRVARAIAHGLGVALDARPGWSALPANEEEHSPS